MRPAGPGADYGDIDARLLLGGLVVDVLVLHGVVAQRALDGVDAHAVVGVLDVLGGHDRHAVAVVLTQVRADAAGDGGHRVHAVEDLSRSGPVARAELLHVGADVGVVRAAAGAADGARDLHAAEDGVYLLSPFSAKHSAPPLRAQSSLPPISLG